MSDIEKVGPLQELKLQEQAVVDLEKAADPIRPPKNASENTPSRLEALIRIIDRPALLASSSSPPDYGRNLKWCITVLVSAAALVDSLSPNMFYRKLNLMIIFSLPLNAAIQPLSPSFPTASPPLRLCRIWPLLYQTSAVPYYRCIGHMGLNRLAAAGSTLFP